MYNINYKCIKSVTMKGLAIISMVCIQFFIPLPVEAAMDSGNRISLNIKGRSVREVLQVIESKSNLSFLYRSELLAKTKPVTIQVDHVPITEILDQCLSPNNLEYSVVNNTVIVRERKEPAKQVPHHTSTFQQLIAGRVQTQDGEPLIGVSVRVQSKETGTTTDERGGFQVAAEIGDVLLFSSVGYASKEVNITSTNALNVTLVSQSFEMEELVVTAFGIRRSRNNLPYAAQQVSGEDINKTRTGTVASSLSGKVAGLQIKQGNSMGGSTNVVIRGMKSLTGNNQALFVVDGVPVDNSNYNSSGQQTGRGGYDYGSAASDINPDDIASINVLKGAAASALYGSRAANGVIMITTKKGREGFGITVNAGMSVGNIDKSTFVKLQDQYGAGYSDPYQKDGFLYFDVNGDGERDLVVPTAQNASYGARFDPNLMVYHWDAFGDETSPYYKTPKPWVAGANKPDLFYETSKSNNTSIYLDGASDKGMFKFGYTRNDEKGSLPNSALEKNLFNLGGSYNITDKISISTSANYSKADAIGRYGSGYSKGNVNMYFRQWYQTNIDILEQKEAFFRNPDKNFTTNWSDPSVPADRLLPFHANNFYWTRYNNYANDTRNRFFGNVELNLKATDWLNFMGRVSLDYYNEFQEERTAVSSSEIANYSRRDRTYSEVNYDFLATANHTFAEDFDLSGLAGVNLRKNVLTSEFKTTEGGLVVPWLYNIANSVGLIPAPVELYQPKAVDGYFGGATLTYRQFLTLDGSFRRDRSSTLPVEMNAYNYYALSGSWLFSTHLSQVSWLSSGKLTANYATVGNDAPWGSLANIYNKPDPFGNTVLFAEPTTRNNSQLKPERTISKEIGLSLSFLNNRISFDASVYHTNTIDQIMPVAVSTATGYSNMFVNAGDIQNRGMEMTLAATPVRQNGFSWDFTLNWSLNRNKVISLYEGSQNLQLGSFQNGVSINATVGQPYGTIQGKTWEMVNGEKLVGANGRYVMTSTTNNIIGNVNPDWIGGMYNTFSYRNLSLGFLIDVQQGGDLYSLDMDYGLAAGIFPETVALNDKGNPSRDRIVDGGGVVLPGVTADGQPNTTRVEQIFGTYGYVYNPPSATVYDASYVKLREATLNFKLPTKWYAGVDVIRGIDMAVIGRNLWIIHKNLPYSDPEENLSSGNIQGYQAGAYPTVRTIGFNVKLTF